LLQGTAHAEPAKGKPPAWADGITWSAQIQAGGTYNEDGPNDNKNFGRLFDDKSNGFLLNQVLLTAQRPIDTSIKGYDVGFKLQGMYGSDARYTHILHQFQHATGDSLNQLDLVEAFAQAHTPWLTKGGTDFKLGQFVTLEGAETIDPSTNYLYSHSYIFNFGIPLKHTGLMAVFHVVPEVDIYAGLVTGANTGLGKSDNNDALAFHGGVGLNLLGGKLTSLATTHIGPETAQNAIRNGLLPASVDADGDLRYLSDITTTWKVTDKLTLINDVNWIHDEVANAGRSADGFGMAQYGVYTLCDMVSLVARAEVFRDVDGVFVFQSGNNVDFLNALDGMPARSTRTVTGGKTTYGALTLGANVKPDLGIAYLSGVRFRPEIRYDTSLNDTRPFNDSSDKHMFTAAIDMILQF